MYKTLEEVFEKRKVKGLNKKLIVAAAEDDHVLDSIILAKKEEIIEPVLIGHEEKIHQIAEKEGYDLTGITIINELDPAQASIKAVQMIHDGEGEILMKGLVDSSSFLRPILSRKYGLRMGDTLSHAGIIEIPSYHKVFCLTDAAFNIAPDLDTKIGMVKNAVFLMRKLGIERPKIAALGAYEFVNQKMQATMDAALLAKMAQRGQIRNCIIEGPMSFDNAVMRASAESKHLDGGVAGDADILLAPNLESANVLYKSFVSFAKAKPAGLIMGASVPAILMSRTDSTEVKLNSIKLAASVDFRS
jgi:phosphate butyryltransferase